MTTTNRRHDDVDVVRTTSTMTRLRLDIVVATLQHNRQPSSVVWDIIVDDDRRHGVCISAHSVSQRPAMAIHLWCLSGQFCYACPVVPVPAWLSRSAV